MCTVVAELEGILVPKLLQLKWCYHKLKILKMEFTWVWCLPKLVLASLPSIFPCYVTLPLFQSRNIYFVQLYIGNM